MGTIRLVLLPCKHKVFQRAEGVTRPDLEEKIIHGTLLPQSFKKEGDTNGSRVVRIWANYYR